MLNAERVRLQPAVEVARGIQASLTEGDLSRAWYDALCLLDEQVDEVEFRGNLARAVAQAKSRSHWEG